MSKFAKFGAVAGCAVVLAYGALSAIAQAVVLPPSRCSAVIQFEPYLGDKCMTLKGGVFTRVWNADSQATGWKSEQTGLIWFETITRGLNQVAAEKLCASQAGQSLPSAQDFVEAEIAGIRELFPVMRNLALWTGTVLINDSSEAYYFAGSEGSIGHIARLSREENAAAICVSPAL